MIYGEVGKPRLPILREIEELSRLFHQRNCTATDARTGIA